MKAKTAPKARRATPAAIPERRLRNYDLWYAAGLAVLGFAIYARCLWGPFLFDDIDIMEPRSAARIKDLYVILTGPRPLLILTYALNHWWAGGFNAFHFHVVSVVLHIINALLVWGIVRRLCDSPGLAGWLTPGIRPLLIYFTPLLFLASPIQTESVAYISSRSELLAGTFYLLALLVFLSGWRERRPWVTAGLVALFYGCSVTSKQHGLTLPGAILLADYFFLAGQDWRKLKKNWPTYAVLGVLMVVGGFIVVRAVINVPSAGFFLKEVTWKDYLFTQFRMYFLYLRLLLIPAGLNVDYDITPSRTLWEHFSWLALLGIAAILGAALYFRKRYALAAFGVLFFFLALFPTSSFYPLLDYAAERRLYLPSIGFFLCALGLVLSPGRDRKRAVYCLAAVVGLYALGAHARNRVWADSLALWEDTVRKSPGKWRVYTWLGREYSDRGRFVEATAAYQKANELVGKGTLQQADILSSLGSTYANRKMYAEAIEIYHQALKITPNIAVLWTNLGIAEVRLNRPEGWSRFEKAIEVNGLAWEPHLARANLYYQMGRYEDAIKDYERVLYLLPDHPDARHNLNAARAMQQLKPQR